MIGFAGGPQRGKVNEIEKQGSLLCHFGGVVNGVCSERMRSGRDRQ